MDYGPDRLEERDLESVQESLPFKELPTVTWLNLVGLHETAVIEEIGAAFGLHPLVLEDILNTRQRPKFEDHGDYVFLVVRTMHYLEEKRDIRTEQIALVLGRNFVISFQEFEADPFGAIRDRLRTSAGRIRGAGPDYLAYALVDAIVDHYFVILERIGDHIEELGDETIGDPTPDTLRNIQTLRKDLGHLRRSVWPLREVASAMERSESALVKESTGPYLRDVYDHTIQVIETLESYRDMISGMFDTYLSSVSNRMNEVMKVLTIIATIFIPITFVAGVYGMNFQHMPELAYPWAYPAALGVMLIIALAMIAYFRRKRWL
ncbi:MAG: magnesium/cobalt transporter CorA [Candidatus Eisenbacteria bacterium]|nr:magnesium/cobalt transporter CorA [Candidatus Eisenbacteria bacterium]